MALGMFRSLQTIRLQGPMVRRLDADAPPEDEEETDEVHVPLVEALQANEATLIRLSVWRDAVWACPVRFFTELQELEVIGCTTLEGFEPILAQCAELRYLTLDLPEGITTQFVHAVQSYPAALPQLIAFKLLYPGDLDADQSALLAHFLSGKRSLRMLDLGCDRFEENCQIGSSLYGILHQLPALETLGLTVKRSNTPLSEIPPLVQCIPSRLTALMLRWDVYTVRLAKPPLIDLVSDLQYDR